MAKKKCYKCKKSYDTNDMTQVFKHWLCPNCHQAYITSEEYYKEKFLDDAWNLYTNKPSYFQLEGQADTLHQQYGFTYQGMSFALKCYVLDHEWDDKYLLYQAFPQAYYDGKEMYRKQRRLKKSIPKEFKTETRTITARRASYKPPLPL